MVGGALQGMEAVLLSRKAGFETVVIDRREDAPALSLSDSPVVLDPLKDPEEASRVMEGCDAVIPACEEIDLLRYLDGALEGTGVPFLFDLDAYEISCSKVRSNELMRAAGVPLPGTYPGCGFPVVVKPSSQSGSIGVSVAFDSKGVEEGLKKVRALNDEPVVQEFVSGKSVSIEMIGDGRDFNSYVTTEVVLDEGYDCKMVVCDPGVLPEDEDEAFRRMSRDVAEAMGLKALMDMEAIATSRGLRVLEVDARIPSQTPAAVQAATGVNLLDELVRSSTGRPPGRARSAGSSVYRHVVFKDGVLRACGEKEFSHVRSPRMGSMFGADDMITDFYHGSPEWRGTLITSGRTGEEAMERSDSAVSRIMDECSVDTFFDGSPEVL